ncbi:olfactory receptor 5M11-like [Bombina bombina]|uniref:olfactory receptor 5M11-like n=1 Tax=Bombina bombina TaxID=8345 RepID=UPI00235AFF7E|nr:olfactory receptor 5M11-like [Bombina bombina]
MLSYPSCSVGKQLFIKIELANQTMVPFYILKGISDVPELQTMIFLLVLLIYLITLGGNMTIFLLICLDNQLHTPMYFFLGNLSLLDMCCTTLTLHKVPLNYISGDNSVSLPACMTQMYLIPSLMADELLVITGMSFDRYVAICNPLRYHMIMNRRLCGLLATICWVLGFIYIIPYIILLLRFTCYTANVINHFYCDLVPLIKMSCSDTTALELVIQFEGTLLGVLIPISLTFISYILIIAAILRISSSTGRRKSFYTCSSHLTVVILLYTTLICQYLTPTSMDSLDYNKLFSLFIVAVVPMLNPMIYSLKNKDVKAALKRRLKLL